MTLISTTLLAVGLLVAAPADGATAPAQGSITGSVSDASGSLGHFASVLLSTPEGVAITSAQTDLDGVYNFQGLAAGSYRVQFSAPGYAEQWFGGSPFPSQSKLLQLTAGGQLTGINATMAKGASISGRAYYDSQLHWSSDKKTVMVTAWTTDPGNGKAIYLGAGSSDVNDTYTIDGLPAGTYTLQFSSFSSLAGQRWPYVSKYWGGTPTRIGATPVTVPAGTALTGYDMTLLDQLPPQPVHDYSGDGNTDLLAITNAGALFSYMGNGNGGWSVPTAAQVGSGWNGMRLKASPGDFDGDGHPDLLGVDLSGQLWLYPGNGHNGWGSRRLLATGWQSITTVAVFGDFYGYGTNDIVAKDQSGILWLYRGNGVGGLEPNPRAIGSGWNTMTSIIGGTDFNNDGFPDILARDSAGILWVYPEDHGVWSSRYAIGSGWNTMTAIVSAGSMSADRSISVLARDSAGALWLYTYSPYVRSWGPRKQIGSGWNMFTWIG